MALTENIANTTNAGAEKAGHIVGEKLTVATIGSGAVAGGVGLAAVLSAALSQMEYEGKRRSLKNILRDELAAITGKPRKKVKDADIDVLAKNNSAVAEHIDQARKQRNIGIGVIFAATMVTAAVVVAASASVLPVAAFVAGANSGTLFAAASFIANAVVAAVAYSVVKIPMEKVAHKFFELDKKTTLEKIVSLQKDHEAGKTISADSVMSVFIDANPELDGYIMSKYGRKFSDMTVADKLAITETIGAKLNVQAITDDINLGRKKATELAFAIEGKMSGVLPDISEESKSTVLMTIKEKLHNAGDMIYGNHPANHAPAKSFVERTVRVPRSQAAGYTKSIEEARAAQESAVQQR